MKLIKNKICRTRYKTQIKIRKWFWNKKKTVQKVQTAKTKP